MKKISIPLLIFLSVLCFSCKKNPVNGGGLLQLVTVKIGNTLLTMGDTVKSAPVEQPLYISFASGIDTNSLRSLITLKDFSGTERKYSYSTSGNLADLTITPKQTLDFFKGYNLTISADLKGKTGETFPGLIFRFITKPGTMTIDSVSLNGVTMYASAINVDPKKVEFHITFTKALNPDNYKSSFVFSGPALSYALTNGNKTVVATNSSNCQGFTKYYLTIGSTLTSADGNTYSGSSLSFITAIDSTYKFPLISDDSLLTLAEYKTFRYFWDFGHPVCGMARERNTSGDVVTTGGSGFGIMAMVVGMNRGFISRADGLTRLNKILTFLETCDRFHGAWPHWLNGVTGKVQPFSPTDNGSDIVETSYMVQGLLCMRQYLDSTVAAEKTDIGRINNLFKAIEFDSFTNGQNALFWLYSPDNGFGFKVQGYNETLITYIIAASSPTHSISKTVYTSGYANNGGIVNGQSYYGYKLPLGEPYGGPLFFTQYTYLGIDPRNLSDQYANYWEQNVNQSLIDWAYCKANPKKWAGYSDAVWGLTASDIPTGYGAQSPTNDIGVITPTAALSAFPYTPDKSMKALKSFYYFLGDHLWGDYGFYDAFDPAAGWWATSTLAIDQGPIVCMIENYRTGLLWNLTMSAPEIKAGLTKLGFTY